ncbi:MAG TPA: hypothetical protein VF331_23060 [Polyangiales bacterium]
MTEDHSSTCSSRGFEIGCKLPITQLLVEFHRRFERIGLGRTKAAIAALRAEGFRILDVCPSGQVCVFVAVSALG